MDNTGYRMQKEPSSQFLLHIHASTG